METHLIPFYAAILIGSIGVVYGIYHHYKERRQQPVQVPVKDDQVEMNNTFDPSAFRTEFVNELNKTKTYDEGRSLLAKYKQMLGHEHTRIQNFMYLRVETREYDSY